MDSGLRNHSEVVDTGSIEQLSASFAQACEKGVAPSIELFISEFTGDDAEALLLRLIDIEVMHQLASGGEVNIDTYVVRFPEHAERITWWFSSHIDAGSEGLMGSTIGLANPLSLEPETRSFRFRVLGRYELRAFIGRGAFGEVWRAYDPQLRREVALKTPRDDYPLSDEILREFVAEGRKAARLQHPRIVRVYDAGECLGRCYIVSELIHGGTLCERMSREPLSNEEAFALVRDVANALHYAHQQGVIHRDIKPGNILLDAKGQAHISDFGLAKMEGAGESVVRQGTVVGTPAYMSPEQASGQSHEVDARTDVYSLGVVLFELLERRRPFSGSGRLELLGRIQRGQYESFQGQNAAIAEEPQRICRKAMALRPEDRYATAAEFADDLQTLLQPETVLAEPAPTNGRGLGKWVLTGVSAAAFFFAAWMIIATQSSRPDNSLPVQITSEPAGASITFIPLDPSTGAPTPKNATPAGRSPATRTWLVPGRYLVVAGLDDGRFHEVYRTIPQPGVEVRGSGFWHMWWERQEDGTILLPTIYLPLAEVADGMQRFEGDKYFRLVENKQVQWMKIPAFYADSIKVNRRIFDERLGLDKLPSRFTARPAEERKPFEEAQAPLTYVSWDEATHFAERAGLRLLDEAEYAFAATQAISHRGSEVTRGDWLDSVGEWTSNRVNSGPIGPNKQVISSSERDRVVRGLLPVPGSGDEVVALEAMRDARVFFDKREARPDIGFRFGRSTTPRLTTADFVLPSSDVSENR